MLNLGILTISDKGSRGERQDKSGEAIRNSPLCQGNSVVRYNVVPDEVDAIVAKLVEWADSGEVDVILTTGGTGLGLRDITPEATLSVVDRVVPGLTEAMRFKTFDMVPSAILSRAAAGTRGRCLIVNLPGSAKAVQECLEIIAPVIPHAVDILTGVITEHAPDSGGS